MKNKEACMNSHYSLLLVVLTSLFPQPAIADQYSSSQNFLAMTLEELSQIKVHSVSKREEALTEAAASIFVITHQDIRQSGATTIPEVLRLAPNLQVARINATQYAITARGFNNLVSNKLLVLVDGRTIYTPLFSGVFWDQQDLVLEDIERIEVISGPGATLWGANAVNGVINIVTRAAADTQGLLASAYGGNSERGAALRYGGAFGETGHFRVYTKAMELDETTQADGTPGLDMYERVQAGFRADWGHSSNHFTVQGDIYDGTTGDRGAIAGFNLDELAGSGRNLLARWNREFDGGSHFQLQAYWDYSKRKNIVLFQPTAEIFDVGFQHSIPLSNHNLLWGGGYRHAHDDIDPGFFATFVPDSRELNWENLFIQDEIILRDDLIATLGIRFESNDYTGVETLPNARLAWNLSRNRLLWTALSRAVRAPSRYDRDVYFPAPPNSLVVGGPNFKSEVANVFEVGYRYSASDSINYSITAFYHDWEDLRSGTAIPVELENKIEGPAYGLEAWANYQVNRSWRLSAGGTTFSKELELEPDSTDPVGIENDTLHNDPDYQLIVRSLLEVSDNSMFNLSVRHVADLPHPEVPSYTVFDANYAWQPRENLEMSFTVRNVADRDYREFEEAANGSEFERSAILKIVWAE